LAARAGHWKCEMRIDSALYESSAAAMLSWIKGLEDAPECLLLTGHEPTWSDLAGRLVGKALIRVPTGAMLRIDLEIETWQQIEFGVGELRWLLPPKMVCSGKNGK
ncbi:MAG: histidine phosphatase family protein, partial [Gammaproteobacteria bacterium]|nr:histidine phosphatase family protein [Gammaproteobacteria bacterium]